MTTAENWGNGSITIPKKTVMTPTLSTGNVAISSPAAFDWDGDGFDDVVAIVEIGSDLVVQYLRNLGVDGSGNFLGLDPGGAIGSTGFDAQTIYGPHAGLTTASTLDRGDVDGDGDMDLVFIHSHLSIVIAYMLPFTGLDGSGMPQFGAAVDLAATLSSVPGFEPTFHSRKGQYFRLADFDGDGCDDLVTSVGPTYPRQDLVLWRGCATSGAIFDNPQYLPHLFLQSLHMMEIIDIHADGVPDLLLVSRSGGSGTEGMQIYENDGMANISLYREGRVRNGEAGFVAAADFDQDGDDDILMSKRDFLYGAPPQPTGEVNFIRNDYEFFRMKNDPVLPIFATDGLALNLNGDTTPDFFMSNSDSWVVGIPRTFNNLFELESNAESVIVEDFNGDRGVFSVQIDVDDSVPTGTRYDLFVANNLADWELVDPAERYGGTHVFENHGDTFAWRVEMHADAEALSSLTPSELAAHPAARDTPVISELRFTIQHVEKRRFSNSSTGTGAAVNSSGLPVEVALSASFEFPSGRGFLTAYDISQLPAQTAPIESVSNRSDVSVLWEADTPAPTSRRIYTGLDRSGDGLISGLAENALFSFFTPVSDRDAIRLEMGTLMDSVSLVLNRYDWSGNTPVLGPRLMSPGRSTPLIVNAPNHGGGSQVFKNLNYSGFQATHSARRGRVYLTTHDAMLHAFDLETGEEDWAYIPPNLLSQLKRQFSGAYLPGNDIVGKNGGLWVGGGGTQLGDLGVRHVPLLDAEQTVADVYDSAASQWRTILISGQGIGIGRGGNNYLFAVDITDQSASSEPHPLWEFTDAWCTGIPCTAMGETWSKPAVGPVSFNGSPRFMTFFASGYNNLTGYGGVVGRSLYALDAVTGALVAQWTFDEIVTGADNPSTIDNSLPGSPTLADVNNDGYIDRVYIGDLEGRLWKVELQNQTGLSTSGLVSHSDWPACVLFDAGDPDGDGTRTWAPIITKPGVGFPDSTPVAGIYYPNVYFGTGGDDRAPDALSYHFLSVRDDQSCPSSGISPTPLLNASNLNSAENEWMISGDPDDRFWSSPLVINDEYVVFASLPGSVEQANPCDNVSGQSKIYGIAMRTLKLSDGRQVAAGNSVYDSTNFLLADSKIRQAAFVRGASPSPQVSSQDAPRVATGDVLLQEYASSNTTSNPEVKRIKPIVVLNSGNQLRLLRWREVSLSN